jgi:hypothetical protein
MMSRRGLFLLLLASGVCLGQPIALGNGSGSSGSGGGSSGGGNGGGGNDDDGNDDDNGNDYGEDSDSGVALEAVNKDNAASLKEILAIVKKNYGGDVVKVSLRGSGTGLTYRIKLLNKDNRLFEVLVNAVSRKIIRAKGL